MESSVLVSSSSVDSLNWNCSKLSPFYFGFRFQVAPGIKAMVILSAFKFIVTEKKKIHNSRSYNEALQLYHVKRQKVKSHSVKDNGSFSTCTATARLSPSDDCGKQKRHKHSLLDHITEEYHRGLFSL